MCCPPMNVASAEPVHHSTSSEPNGFMRADKEERGASEHPVKLIVLPCAGPLAGLDWRERALTMLLSKNWAAHGKNLRKSQS